MEPLAPGQRPAFLQEQTSDTYPGVVDEPTFDHELAEWVEPNAEHPEIQQQPRGITERWRAVARLYALGQKQITIAKRLNYSPTAVGQILKQPWVKAEVARYRAQYETDLTARVRDAAIDGVDRIHRIILDEEEKTTTVLDASKWAVEKVSGKARQEVNVEHGTLNAFMEMLKGMQARGEALDVTPNPAAAPQLMQSVEPETNQFDSWLDENL